MIVEEIDVVIEKAGMRKTDNDIGEARDEDQDIMNVIKSSGMGVRIEIYT